MFFIPGFLISLLTFPGVIVHELAHQLACRYMKVPVYEVCYFQIKNPTGYVVHGKTENFTQTVVISILPFFMNTIVGLFFFVPGYFSTADSGLDLLLMWFGISVLMHAFPSREDLHQIFQGMKEKKLNFFAKLIMFPVACVMWIGTVGSVIWLDLGYAILMVSLVQMAIVYA